MEPRAMLAAAAVQLAPVSQSGGPAVTNSQEPTFNGTVAGYSIVQLFAQRIGDAAPRFLGQTESDPAGDWSLTVGPLHDGAYTVFATVTSPGVAPVPNSFPTPPIYLQNGTPQGGTLVVDTSGPRVAALGFDPASRSITVIFQDAWVGLDPLSVTNPNNYVLVSPNHLGVALTPQIIPPAPAVTGFYTTSQSELLKIPDSVPLPPGHYTFGILSGGVRDLAGNPLDGEFHGTFPSGNGQAGGNFVATLTVPRSPVVHARSLSHSSRSPA
jgi:hypothetical protein